MNSSTWRPIVTLCAVVVLASCDSRTLEQIEADGIARCQAMISKPRPVVPDGPPSVEIGKIRQAAEEYENCRRLIEDLWLPNEQLPNGWGNSEQVNYEKIGNQVVRGSADHLQVGTQAFSAHPYVWRYDYRADEVRYGYPIKAGKQSGVLFLMASVHNAWYAGHLNGAYSIEEVCKHADDPDPKIRRGGVFIWHDIFFEALISGKQVEREWRYICPVAVASVQKHLSIVRPAPH
jgi:hypothetical protein